MKPFRCSRPLVGARAATRVAVRPVPALLLGFSIAAAYRKSRNIRANRASVRTCPLSRQAVRLCIGGEALSETHGW